MDKDQKALINRLFALATALLEDAHSAAVNGQSNKRKAAEFLAYAKTLQSAANTIHAIADVIVSLAESR